MKFYGIDMQGKLFIEEANITPATSEHDRRFVRDTDGRIYVGNTSVGNYVELISDYNYGTLPSQFKLSLDGTYHPLGGTDTDDIKARYFNPITSNNRIQTEGDWFHVAVTDPVDVATGQGKRWAGLMVETDPLGSPDDNASIFYAGEFNMTDAVDPTGFGWAWRLEYPDVIPANTNQIIATREYCLATFLQGSGTGVGSGELANYYQKTETDARYLTYTPAGTTGDNIRDFSGWDQNVVYTNGHIAAQGFGAVEARIASATSTTYSPSAGANHVVQRNGSGNIFANIGYLTASQAFYADLAEKYTCDPDLPIGTVVAVPVESHSDYEAVPFDFDSAFNVIGVVSENPAFIMNGECEGLPIALTGRVPVRVCGEIRKGDFIVASAVNKGCAIKGNYETNYDKKIGIVLETNLQEGEKLVECIIK
jgi:hypothetical protein